MVRTFLSILIALALILAGAFYELYYVKSTFSVLKSTLLSLYDKSESKLATYEDGRAVQTFWEEKKKYLQIFLPHTALLEVDYQLGEAVGFLYVQDYESVIPKLEILIAMAENIPESYTFGPENIF